MVNFTQILVNMEKFRRRCRKGRLLKLKFLNYTEKNKDKLFIKQRQKDKQTKRQTQKSHTDTHTSRQRNTQTKRQRYRQQTDTQRAGKQVRDGVGKKYL